MATISYKHNGDKFSVKIKACDDFTTFEDFVHSLVKPLVLAIGYSPTLVDRLYIASEDEK